MRLPGQFSFRAGNSRGVPASGGTDHRLPGRQLLRKRCGFRLQTDLGERLLRPLMVSTASPYVLRTFHCSIASVYDAGPYIYRVATVISVALYVQGVVWNAATTRAPESRGMFFVHCKYMESSVFTRAALLSLAATGLGVFSYILLRAQAPPAATPSSTAPAAPPASGPHGPKPDAPPAGEAVAIPMERYGQAWSPQSSRQPQRQAQPAYEVMMA